MFRTCDGTDPNLTRSLPAGAYTPHTMTLSPWDSTSAPGTVTVNCQCGLCFDDAGQMVTYPHDPVGGVGIARALNLTVPFAAP